MVSNNICSSVSNTNDESSNALVSSNCKSNDCHCEGNGIVTTQSGLPNVTQKCYVTNSGCHEAVVTTTTQEIRRHKCPPKIQKVHEHISTPAVHNCSPQLNCIPCNASVNCIPCNGCDLGMKNTCCNKHSVCLRNQISNIPTSHNRHHCHHHHACSCSCCCCSTSTVQTTLYPVYMSYPFTQGRNIDVPYTSYSTPYNSGYYSLTEGSQYPY